MLTKAIVFLLVLMASGQTWSTQYFYSGPQYASVGGAYTTDMRITGSFSTVAPLAPNLSNVELGPYGLNLITDWSFNDGVSVYMADNSVAYLYRHDRNFVVSTDADGNITAFVIGLQKPAPGASFPVMIDAFNISSSPAVNSATSQTPCINGVNVAMEIYCVQFDDPGSNFGTVMAAGSFRAEPKPVPLLSTISVLILISLITAVVAFYRPRKM